MIHASQDILTRGLWRARRVVLGLALTLGLALLHSGPAGAASLQVSPISLEFSPAEQAQSVWLSNSGTATVRAQVRVQQWSQPDGVEQLSATRELVASPPVVEIPPGGKQMVRIIRLQPAPPAQEQAFRLIIDELPEVVAPAGAATSPGLQFLLRYSVPVFVALTEPVPANNKPSDISALSASLRTSGSQSVLSVSNAGPRRVKISQLVHVDAEGRRTPLAPGLLGYVLAGQRMQWPLNLPAGQVLPANGTLKAKFNADLEEQTLPLASNRS